ncbi:MAG: hypothetical protein D6698_01390 [Gammaproteobacteria bacterium]|nr:MAG: hypothetical protein D6698_01390 [Gammaproteobacteria bacterium]
MALTPEQQEEVENLKKWWKENGVTVISTFVITAAVLFGWTYWKNYQLQKKEESSRAFAKLVMAPNGQDGIDPPLDTAKLDEYIKQHEGSGYSTLAAFYAAKAFVDKKDFSQAERELRWVIANADATVLQEIARFRLARVLVAQKKLDEALQQAMINNDPAFTGLFAELRGDIHYAKDELESAKEDYEEAAGYPYVDLSLLELKLMQVGGTLH